MKKIMGILAIASSACFAQETQDPNRIKTPAEVQAELDQAERDFEAAKDLFIPWYTGPLITGSANNIPKGKTLVQAYLFLNNQYASFNDNRKSVNIPDIFTVQPLAVFAHGYTDFVDGTLVLDGFFRWQSGEYARGFGDITYNTGLQLVKQTPYVPSVRLVIGEIFPTGKYQNFNSNHAGIAATGGGVFATQFGLFLSKVFWKIKKHPINARVAFNYVLPNHRAHVRNFNAYGGGFGTNARVRVGHSIQAGGAVEVSLTQKWAFALDIAYDYNFETTFSGFAGTNADGTPAGLGGPSGDQLSFAPAIEYNPSDHEGFIGGIWFSVTGRNSANFVAGVLSYYWLF